VLFRSKDNSCGKRFGHQLGELPAGYDHKYTYSHIGYNLKATDFQAAVGLAQLDRLDGFIAARRRNYAFLRDALAKHESLFEFVAVLPGAEPSWFGFAMRVRESAPFDRNALVAFLESRLIATRLLFGGNLLRQPAYQGAPMRLAGPLDHADQVMRGTFWVGCHPGLTQPMLQWIVDSVEAFVGGARA
jgi:CDP-6-deoxy-D-xylo-4-hexulose-3-dehydrase